jgi:hypothetical protein
MPQMLIGLNRSEIKLRNDRSVLLSTADFAGLEIVNRQEMAYFDFWLGIISNKSDSVASNED